MMPVTILVDSQFGNTARLAEAGLTIHRGLSAQLDAMLDAIEGHVRGLAVAAFDRAPGDVTLVPGELDRARSWGSSLRHTLAARKAA